MKTTFLFFVLFGLLALLVYPFAAVAGMGIIFGAALIELFNFAALITAVISYCQFFFPSVKAKEERGTHAPFHTANIFLVLLYFMVSMYFLIAQNLLSRLQQSG